MNIELNELKEDFLEYLIKDGNTILCEQLKCEDRLSNLFGLVQGRKLKETEAKYYLESENNFFIEMFIRFVKEAKPALPPLIYKNFGVIQKLLWKKAISSNDYNERIRAKSLQFQIDNYYQPKEEWARRRIGIVLDNLNPKTDEFTLDIGCGVGTFVYRVALAGGRGFGIDYSQESLCVARKLLDKFGLRQQANFIVANAMALPFKARIFDKIICADFIEHITLLDKILLLDEICRVVKEGGLIVVFTPNGFREWLGFIKRRLVFLLNRKPIVETRLHFGLTNRFAFERLLRKKGFSFKCYFMDESRPMLAKIPFLKEVLSLHILWKVWK